MSDYRKGWRRNPQTDGLALQEHCLIEAHVCGKTAKD